MTDYDKLIIKLQRVVTKLEKRVCELEEYLQLDQTEEEQDQEAAMEGYLD